MKCYYCEKECEGFVFEQGDFSAFSHRNCAVEQVDKYGDLQKKIEKMDIERLKEIMAMSSEERMNHIKTFLSENDLNVLDMLDEAVNAEKERVESFHNGYKQGLFDAEMKRRVEQIEEETDQIILEKTDRINVLEEELKGLKQDLEMYREYLDREKNRLFHLNEKIKKIDDLIEANTKMDAEDILDTIEKLIRN